MKNILPFVTRLIDHLRTAIGAHLVAQMRLAQPVIIGANTYYPLVPPPRLPPLPLPVWRLFCRRLGRLASRFQRLYERWRAGTLPKPRPARLRAPRPARPNPPPRLPRANAWVNHRIPGAAFSTGQLDMLLHEPEMREFVAAAPQAGRLLRPLCRALGVRLPAWLKPARPPAPAPATQPAPAESWRPDTSLPDPPSPGLAPPASQKNGA